MLASSMVIQSLFCLCSHSFLLTCSTTSTSGICVHSCWIFVVNIFLDLPASNIEYVRIQETSQF